jgi:hypothetical protein
MNEAWQFNLEERGYMATQVIDMETFEGTSNDAKKLIQMGEPYLVTIGIRGVAKLLLHRWSAEAVAEKAAAAKGSKAKKTDDVESYVYRDGNGTISLPSEYLRQSLIHAAKFQRDPRSPRKSAMDLFKAGLVAQDELMPLGKDWDFLDTRRVVVNHAGINRTRPGFNEGWQVEGRFTVLLPEYITPERLQEALSTAGRVVGVGDFRPTYGRFAVVKFEVYQLGLSSEATVEDMVPCSSTV